MLDMKPSQLFLGQQLAMIFGMPRPRKDGRLRMDTSLRIPVTSEQKQLIADATRDEPEGMAAWARSVMLQAARAKMNGPPKRQSEPIQPPKGPNENRHEIEA
jgi:hypothetical protein